jgi:ankyrin repeat protein
LIHATIDAKDDFVRRLVEAGADPNKQDKLGNSALHYAAQNFAVTAAKTLIAAGAKIDIVDLHGNTPLWRAVFNSRGRGDVIKQLLAAGADRNHINKSGKTPVNLAQTISNYDMKQFF